MLFLLPQQDIPALLLRQQGLKIFLFNSVIGHPGKEAVVKNHRPEFQLCPEAVMGAVEGIGLN